MAKYEAHSEVSRRDWLAGVSATALLAACGQARKGEAGADAAADAETDATLAETAAADAAVDASSEPIPRPDAKSDGAADVLVDSEVSLPDAASEVADVAVDVSDAVIAGGLPMAKITPNETFYITTYSQTPDIAADEWSLEIMDKGVSQAKVNLAWLQALTTKEKEHTLECIGGGPDYPLISNGIFTGLPVLEIFQKLGVQVPKDAPWLKMTGFDGYSTAIPLTDLNLPMWMVWKLNGQPLPPAHGYPVRLLVPGRYGMKNPKWLKTMEFQTDEYFGYWEKGGWSQTAEYRANAYIFGPQNGAIVPAGKVLVYGTAFAGQDPIALVEVSVNGGAWQPATLNYNGGPDIWTLWQFELSAEKGLGYTVQARCTTQSGKMSVLDPNGDSPSKGFDGSMKIVLNAV